MIYKVKAIGRVAGSIGITHPFTEIVDVYDEKDVYQALYEGKTQSGMSWEHIQKLSSKKISKFDF